MFQIRGGLITVYFAISALGIIRAQDVLSEPTVATAKPALPRCGCGILVDDAHYNSWNDKQWMYYKDLGNRLVIDGEKKSCFRWICSGNAEHSFVQFAALIKGGDPVALEALAQLRLPSRGQDPSRSQNLKAEVLKLVPGELPTPTCRAWWSDDKSVAYVGHPVALPLADLSGCETIRNPTPK